MRFVFKHELRRSLHTGLAYIGICLFLLLSALVLWIYPQTSVLHSGFATLQVFFDYAPYLFLFIVPAWCMRLISEERKSGTLEWLLSKPVTARQITVGKFLSVCMLILLSLLPTAVFVYSISRLSPATGLDYGAMVCAYFGLYLVATAFAAIGIFASSVTSNQVNAFLLASFLCYFFFIGLESLGLQSHPTLTAVPLFGFTAHYVSISRGVLDSRDLAYFLAVIFVFVALATLAVGQRALRKIFIQTAVFIVVVVVTSRFYVRLDLTTDKTFTLSTETKQMIKDLKTPVHIDCYLDGEMPVSFRKLRAATIELLHELKSRSSGKLSYNTIDPFIGTDQERGKLADSLEKSGLAPLSAIMRSAGSTSQHLLFPYLSVATSRRTVNVALVEPQPSSGELSEQTLKQALELTEYNIISAIEKASRYTLPKIGILSDERTAGRLADLTRELSESYQLSKIDFASTSLADLQSLRLVIVVKPQKRFSEAEKYKLDQFVMGGGRLLLTVDYVKAELDSLQNRASAPGIANEINLDDLLFKWGVRVNYNLVEDLVCAPIPVLNGSTSTSGQQAIEPWVYFPLLEPVVGADIVRGIKPVRCQFLSSIDTLERMGVKKTVLLASSPYSRLVDAPVFIDLNELDHIDTASFNQGPKAAAVLLEGSFESGFKSRRSMQDSVPFREHGSSAIVVVADGDLLFNQINPVEKTFYPLGFDKYSRQTFGNKQFAMNVVDYLCGQSSLFRLRAKTVRVRSLDLVKVATEAGYWQRFNLLIPQAFVAATAFFVFAFRLRRFS